MCNIAVYFIEKILWLEYAPIWYAEQLDKIVQFSFFKIVLALLRHIYRHDPAAFISNLVQPHRRARVARGRHGARAGARERDSDERAGYSGPA